MNLSEMRSYVREHIDLDSTDLSDTLVDIWLRQGYRTVQEYTHNWTHLVSTEQVFAESNTVDVSDWRSIQEVRIDRWTLNEVPHVSAQMRWPENTASSGTPTHYSFVGLTMYLWPKPSAYSAGVPAVPAVVEWGEQLVYTFGGGHPDLYASPGDLFYFDITNYSTVTGLGGELYIWQAGYWVGPVSLVVGSGEPDEETVADFGDYYADISDPFVVKLYGPKTGTPEVPEVPASGGVALYLRGVTEPGEWPGAGATGTSVPGALPSRLHELVARWALANAYAREGENETANELRNSFVGELEQYKRRTINLSGNERFAISDGTGDSASYPTRMRYDWE
jgi:hypothetical protein